MSEVCLRILALRLDHGAGERIENVTAAQADLGNQIVAERGAISIRSGFRFGRQRLLAAA